MVTSGKWREYILMKIPKEVKKILTTLEAVGFEAYIVGGCVRDILLEKKPKDWDVATNANPDEIQKLFPDSFYENRFGTVGVKISALFTKSEAKQSGDSENEAIKVVEVTTYRVESNYSDKRHPDKVKFTTSLEEDLKRRDFTINALAMSVDGKLVDLFNGMKDLKEGFIKAVGNPDERFNEDALRLMRAIRFCAQLNFTIEENTLKAIKKNAELIKKIAVERVNDELVKLISTKNAYNGILFMKDTGLLHIVLLELAKGIGVSQAKHHIYTVFEHNILALKWAAEHDYPVHVRFAALFHDIGKPQTKRGSDKEATFYGHEVVGARIVRKLMERLKFSREFTERVVTLVRYHLFYYNVDEVTESSLRRLIAKVGAETMDDLVKVRICDRMGSGVPKPEPYRLRHFRYMIDKVQKDAISVGMLKVSGNDIMEYLNIKPGPKVGQILNTLLDEVLDDQSKNKKVYLKKRAKELGKLNDNELEKLKKEAVKKQEKLEEKVNQDIKEKYYLK